MAGDSQFRAEVILLGLLRTWRPYAAALDSPVQSSGQIGVSWGEGPNVNDNFFRAQRGLLFGVNFLGDNTGNAGLEHIK